MSLSRPGVARLQPLLLLAIFTGILCHSSWAEASEFLSQEEVIIEAEEVFEGDLYVMARNAIIRGEIKGDLFVMAESIEVTGRVAGSGHLAGETIQFDGQIDGSLRCAGRAINLLAPGRVGRDVMAAGETITTEASSQIDGQLYAAGARLDLGGNVEGKAWLTGESVGLSGVFGDDVNATAGSGSNLPEVKSGLFVADTASVGGNLTVRTTNEPEISETATIEGETTILEDLEPAPAPPDPVRTYVRLALLLWGELLVIGLGFRLILPGRTKRYLDNLHRLPILAVLLGPIYWVLVLLGGGLAIAATAAASAGLYVVELWDVIPLVLLIGFVIVVIIWGGGGLLGLVLGPVLTGVWFCRTLLGWLPGFGRERFLLPVIVGTCLIAAGSAIPNYGWIVWLVAAGFGSGAFLTRSQAEPPPATRHYPVPATKTAKIT